MNMKEILYVLLDKYAAHEMTERYYMFNKMGLVELIKMMTTPQPGSYAL